MNADLVLGTGLMLLVASLIFLWALILGMVMS